MASETIYDHPLYYDILFGWDRSREAEFYRRVFERCGVGAGERILEVACGTGQVARRLARCGFAVSGLDRSAKMLAFARERADAEGVRLDAICADMTSFRCERPFAAAFNPMSSFRLLHSDAEAEAHLRRMAEALRPGGVYVLDLDFVRDASQAAVTTAETWEMRRGDVSVRARDDSVHVDDAGRLRVLAWGTEVHLRAYTFAAFARRVEAAGGLEIEACHPEAGRDDAGTSVFDPERPAPPAAAGRAMVVLRRWAGGPE